MLASRTKSLILLYTQGGPWDRWAPCRAMATRVVGGRRLDRNIQLYQREGESGRPLVLLIGWLFAKPRHISKFVEFYMDNGFDVLALQTYVSQLMVPQRVQKMATSFLEQVTAEMTVPRPLLFHTFSVGGYVYGELLNLIQQQPHKYTGIVDRVKGVIFDSPVDYNGIPSGVAKGATDNRYLREAVQYGMDMFLKMSPTKQQHHINISNIAKENPFNIPAQFLYSLSDPLCEPHKFEALAQTWNQRGVPAFSQVWDIGHHVSTYRLYPEEYKQAVLNFVDSIGMHSHDTVATSVD